jgi:hypothetical protein
MSLSSEGIFRVNKEINFKKAHWGLIDQSGKKLLPIEYEALGLPHENFILAKKKNQWGLIEFTGKILYPFSFDDVRDFEDDVAFVIRDCKRWLAGKCTIGKWGLLHKNGTLLIEPKYDGVEGRPSEPIPHLFGDSYGELIQDEKYFENGFAKIYFKNKSINPIRSYGLISNSGKIIFEPKYNSISFYSQEIATVSTNEGNGSQWFLINSKSEILTKRKYRSLTSLTEQSSNNHLFLGSYIDENRKKISVLVDSNGFELTSDFFLIVQNFNGNYAWFKDRQNGSWGLINNLCEVFLKPKYKSIRVLKNNHTIATDFNQKNSIIDPEGKSIFETEKTIFDFSGEFVILSIGNKFQAIDLNGNSISEKIYETIIKLESDDYRFGIQNRFGMLTKKGREIFDSEYDIESIDSENTIWISKTAIDPIDKEEKIFHSFIKNEKKIEVHSYESREFQEGRAWIKLTGRTKSNAHILYDVMIDKNGKELTPIRYISTLPFRNGLAIGQIFGGAWGYLNSDGKVVWWNR